MLDAFSCHEAAHDRSGRPAGHWAAPAYAEERVRDADFPAAVFGCLRRTRKCQNTAERQEGNPGLSAPVEN
jgi:hypothetical protein